MVAGIAQVLLTTTLGFVVSSLLGASFLVASMMGLALAFSSTIVIVKLISDKGKQHSLYGKISIGILIVQDIVAMLILVGLALYSSFGMQETSWRFFLETFAIIVLAILVVWLLSKFVLPYLVRFFGESQEYILLLCVGRVLILATGFEYVGLTMEVGALIAGMTLSESSKKFLILSKIHPLRDFFVALFFVYI